MKIIYIVDKILDKKNFFNIYNYYKNDNFITVLNNCNDDTSKYLKQNILNFNIWLANEEKISNLYNLLFKNCIKITDNNNDDNDDIDNDNDDIDDDIILFFYNNEEIYINELLINEGLDIADYIKLDTCLFGKNKKVLLTKSTHWIRDNYLTFNFCCKLKTIKRDIKILNNCFDNNKIFNQNIINYIGFSNKCNENNFKTNKYINGKIGLGIITCNREHFLQKCYNSVPFNNIDELIIVNDGEKLKNCYPKSYLIEHDKNMSVGVSKNDAFKYLINKQCEHIFIIEDDIIIKKPDIFIEYIKASYESGLLHLMYGYHGDANKLENGTPSPRAIINYDNNVKIALNHACIGAFCYYHCSLLNKVGLMNEKYKNCWEHVEHSYLCIKKKFIPGFYWWPDIYNSYDYLDELASPDDIQNACRRKDPEWEQNISIYAKYFFEKFQEWPGNIKNPSYDKIISNLKEIFKKKNVTYGQHYQLKLNSIQNSLKLMYGSFEEKAIEQYLCCKHILPNDKVLELGGNYGRVSCILASILNEPLNLVVIEPSKESFNKLKKNKDLNSLGFYIENSAISINKMYQQGWDTFSEKFYNKLTNKQKQNYYEINTITIDEIKQKYNLNFNTLVIDCEGSFYNILLEFPDILDNIYKIIIENDFKEKFKKIFVDNFFKNNNFKLIENIPLPENFMLINSKNEDIFRHTRKNFYQVWIKINKNKKKLTYDMSFKNNSSLEYKIYYINLDRSLHRKQFMENNYKNYIRVVAYDGNNIKSYNDIILPNKCEQNNYQLCCSLSHIKAIIKAYRNNEQGILILEDDISDEYKEKWEKPIENIIKDAPKDMECLSFFVSNCNELKVMVKSKSDYSLHSRFKYSTGAYFINRKGMKKIYNLYYKNNKIDISLKLENYVADDCIIYRQIKTYVYNKPTFINKKFNSTIGSNTLMEISCYNFIKNYFDNGN